MLPQARSFSKTEVRGESIPTMTATQASPQTSRLKAYLSRRLPIAVEQRIAERYDVVRNPHDTILPPAELGEAALGCNYIITSAMQPIPRETFERLSDTLRAIGTLSVGYNHIDIAAAREYGVSVFYSPGVLSDACAELAVMLLLNAARRAHEASVMVRTGEWKGFAPTQLLGVGLVGRRAGIVGMGRIGQATARRLRAFGVELHYHNRHRLDPELELGAVFHESAEDLLRVSDFLFLLAPGSAETAGFLNRERIALLPSDAIVINISRGDTIDDDALTEALRFGRIAAAGLDVFAGEPEIDSRYLTLPNVFLTPHIASATTDTRNAMGFLVLNGLLAMERGIRAENQLC
jgi:lactate dehydrogenase-like 2-hydroxyacid dehydrogenase